MGLSIVDIKRYKEELVTDLLTISAPLTVPSEQATTTQPSPFVAEQQVDQTGKVMLSNMGLDVEAGLDKTVQHFCVDCGMPFRESRMIKFRGMWYGKPCKDYLHAVDILRKEKQRAFRPARVQEPGAVPFVISTDW